MKNILLAVSFVALLTGVPVIDHDLIPAAQAVEMHSASTSDMHPASGAGSASRIARRTTRSVEKHWAAGNQTNVLPSGCTAVHRKGGSYFDCGNIFYTAVFQGSDLVYVAVEKP